jgi:hypothetical protein
VPANLERAKCRRPAWRARIVDESQRLGAFFCYRSTKRSSQNLLARRSFVLWCSRLTNYRMPLRQDFADATLSERPELGPNLKP